MKILVLLSSFVIPSIVSQPVKEFEIDANIVEHGARRYPRDLKSVPPLCEINQFFDEDSNKCMGVIGGGKALHVNNSICGVKELMAHCTSPRHYYVCIGNKLILAQCPDGRHYEEHLQKCVLVPQNRYFSITNRSSPDELPVCERSGSFPVPNDCALFYTCTRNLLGMNRNFYRCPKKMIYDDSIGMCSPSSYCDDSNVPFFCPLSSTIFDESRHLVRRSRPTEKKRTTVVCKTILLNEEESTTKSMGNEETTTDSLIIKVDNDTASTTERDYNTTPAGENNEELITEFQITTSNPYFDSHESSTEPPEVTLQNPSSILTEFGTTEEYYESTPAFTTFNSETNEQTSFDSISSESEIPERTFTEEYSTTQNIPESGSGIPVISTELTYSIQTTTEMNEYTTKEFDSSESTIASTVTSSEELINNDENTEEPFNDSTILNTEFNNENPIVTLIPYLNKIEQTTIDSMESTYTTEESLIPSNDSENNEETSSKILDEIGASTNDGTDVTTIKYDSRSSTDAANNFDTIIPPNVGIEFRQSKLQFDSITLRVTNINNPDKIIGNNLQSIPQENNLESTPKDSVTDPDEELSTCCVTDVTESGITELNSRNSDNAETSEAEESVTEAKTTSPPREMRTVSRHIMLPIASAVLNVTDKLERYLRTMLISYFSRYA